MAYADYGFYKNTYLGNVIDVDDFPRLSERASEYIYGVTQGMSDKATGRNAEAVKKAVCAIAEVMVDEEKMSSKTFSAERPVSSETVGSYSVSYGSPSLSNSEVGYIETRKKEILRIYLGWMFKVRSYPCTHRTR